MIINARCAIFAKKSWKLVDQRRARQHGRNTSRLKIFERPCCHSNHKSHKKLFQQRLHWQPFLQRLECLQRRLLPLLRSRRQFYLHLQQAQDRLAGVFLFCVALALLLLRFIRMFSLFSPLAGILGTRVRGYLVCAFPLGPWAYFPFIWRVFVYSF